jgi:hypothetical protein
MSLMIRESSDGDCFSLLEAGSGLVIQHYQQIQTELRAALLAFLVFLGRPNVGLQDLTPTKALVVYLGLCNRPVVLNCGPVLVIGGGTLLLSDMGRRDV